jgi:hypothetical protein
MYLSCNFQRSRAPRQRCFPYLRTYPVAYSVHRCSRLKNRCFRLKIVLASRSSFRVRFAPLLLRWSEGGLVARSAGCVLDFANCDAWTFAFVGALCGHFRLGRRVRYLPNPKLEIMRLRISGKFAGFAVMCYHCFISKYNLPRARTRWRSEMSVMFGLRESGRKNIIIDRDIRISFIGTSRIQYVLHY